HHAIRQPSTSRGLGVVYKTPGERGDGPDGDPLGCRLNRPHGVCIRNGVVYVTDSESHRIRAVFGLM
ncbi:MAG: hypothetical protein F4122_10725, partial [Gammaproteobacteria bacterium]|nr:hypothetical protein [Gammaproteobacteria bacterium]